MSEASGSGGRSRLKATPAAPARPRGAAFSRLRARAPARPRARPACVGPSCSANRAACLGLSKQRRGSIISMLPIHSANLAASLHQRV